MKTDIFWAFFTATVATVIGIAVACAAVVGFIVLGIIVKDAQDEKEKQITWKNEPPSLF